MPGPLPFPKVPRLRAWFAKNAARETELWVLFYKVHTGRPTVTYAQALEEALCFGWIDGKVMRVDEDSYKQRFTPRRPDSYWSAVNIKKAEGLIAAGRMTRAGREAFERRDRFAARRYSFENRPVDLPDEALAQMKKNTKAWEFWREQPPGYRKVATWYVVSAKRDETRERRLAQVIAHAAQRKRIPLLVSPNDRTRRPTDKRKQTR